MNSRYYHYISKINQKLKSIWFRSASIQLGSSLRPMLQFFLILPIILSHFDEVSVSDYFFYTSIIALVNLTSNSNLVINNLGQLTDENLKAFISSGIAYEFIIKIVLLVALLSFYIFFTVEPSIDILLALVCQSFLLNLDSICSSTMLVRNHVIKLITNELIYSGIFIISFFILSITYNARMALLVSIIISALFLFIVQTHYLKQFFNAHLIFDKSLVKFSFLNSSSSLANSVAVNADRYLFYFILSPTLYVSFSFAKQVWNYANTLSGGFYKGFLSVSTECQDRRTSWSVAVFFILNYFFAVGCLFFGEIIFSWYSSKLLQNVSLFLPIFLLANLLRISLIQDTLFLTMSSKIRLFLKLKTSISIFHSLFFFVLYLLISKGWLQLGVFTLFIVSMIISNIDIVLIRVFNSKRINHFFRGQVLLLVIFILIFYVRNFWL